MPHPPKPLEDFITALTGLIERTDVEAEILAEGRPLLERLVAQDNWLPNGFAARHPEFYRQYLLYRDPPNEDRPSRFSIVSFVWGPGQKTPIHDHTVWGLIGVLRGAETSQAYQIEADGRPTPHGEPARLERGAVEAVSPTIGDVHLVSNAHADRTSISIHVYGADIGQVQRSTFKPDGERKLFISGYSNSEAIPPFILQAEAHA